VPDPHALRGVVEPHKRGSILIAVVFDAFLSLYNLRVADLLRISTGGTGVLPAGQIHPDLVNRLAIEAAETAEEVLRVCIRAMDYVPPVDVTFGEFLRALITADYELSPSARRGNRIAFIDAFRSWGIYPRDVPSLSEESLRWRGPEGGPLSRLGEDGVMTGEHQDMLDGLAGALDDWRPGSDRGAVFRHIQSAQGMLHTLLQQMQTHTSQPLIPGLNLRSGFSVANLRPARRIDQRGELKIEMVVEVVQTYRPAPDAPEAARGPYRGGATLIVDLRSREVRYIIYKRLWERLPKRGRPESGTLAQRFSREGAQSAAGAAQAARPAWNGEDAGSLSSWLAATYACRERLAHRRKRQQHEEPFALLHRDDFSAGLAGEMGG
jgi:hypothetical protein